MYHKATQLFYVVVLSLPLACVVRGQPIFDKGLKNEISITSFNDDFVPPFGDRYFTNGLNITYSRAMKGLFLWRNIISDKKAKAIIRFTIAQEIFTPKNITERNTSAYDRPYAGYLFTNISIDTFWESKTSLQLLLTAGIIGPKAGGRKVQVWWHKLINYSQPEGWETQIDNLPVINLGIKYRRSWLKSNYFEALSTIGAEAGTGFNNLYTGAMVRAGGIKPMDYSAISASRLGGGIVSDSVEKEWFLFLGLTNNFVIHNTLIEGGLFNPAKNEHTETAEFYLITIKTGIAYSTTVFTWKATVHQLSPEVAGGENHRYASLKTVVRF